MTSAASTVGTISLHRRRTKESAAGTCLWKRPLSSAVAGASHPNKGSVLAAHEAMSGCQPRVSSETYTMPHRLTVAGEAAARSCTSKSIRI